jgi:hypothetical protein
VRGAADFSLLEAPDGQLLREVSGLEAEPAGTHVRLDRGLGIKSTQRLALGWVGGGVAVLTWPAELIPQAQYLYSGERAQGLLAAASEAGWDADTRPHLAFWNSSPQQRLYLNPALDVVEYVTRWSGPDSLHIGQHDPDTIRRNLWPWLRANGYASDDDEVELEPFLRRLGRRPAHLRTGLRLLRRWLPEDVQRLQAQGRLAAEIRASLNQLLSAVGDRTLPTR